jgi:hypothetical protein
VKHNKVTEGPRITLDWYDGALSEIRRIDIEGVEPLVQVHSLGWSEGSYPHEMHVMRLNREKVQAMLDMLDGKPVKSWEDQ